MAKDHSEFDYSSQEPVKEAITKSGPAGQILIYYVAAALLAIVVLGVWWAFN
jgi:hypothetical protein